MSRLSISQILKLSENFLALAQQAEPNIGHDDVTVPGSAVDLDATVPKARNVQPTQYAGFKHAIEYLIGQSITNDDWMKWLESNATVLSSEVANKQWTDASPSIMPNAIKADLSEDGEEGWKEAYISTVFQKPSSIAIQTVGVLRGSGVVPKMAFIVGNYVGASPPVSENKALGHYNWLVQSILGIIGNKALDPEEKEMLEPFIIGHRQKLDSIRRQFYHEPRLLGSGADGTAWDIGERRILKVFSDKSSYEHALRAVERLHNNPALGRTEAMIYDVGEIGNFDGRQLYYWIMEQMVPVKSVSAIEDELKFVISEIVRRFYADRTVWRRIKRTKDFNKDATEISLAVKKAAKKFAEDIKSKYKTTIRSIEKAYEASNVKFDRNNEKEPPIPLDPNWLSALAEEILMKYLTGRTDLHLGNLGITSGGKFRYFDPAFSLWKSNVNLPNSGISKLN